VAITVGTQVCNARRFMRCTGAATPTAAITAPLWLRIGAAIARRPASLSSSSIACSRERTSDSMLRIASRLVSVFGV